MLPSIYIDCVELNSEKLISAYISIYLDNILKKFIRDKQINKLDKKLKKALSVKTCKNFPALLDML